MHPQTKIPKYVRPVGFISVQMGVMDGAIFPLLDRNGPGGGTGLTFKQNRLIGNGLTLSVCAGKELMACKQPRMSPSAYDNAPRICAESLKTSRHLLL